MGPFLVHLARRALKITLIAAALLVMSLFGVQFSFLLGVVLILLFAGMALNTIAEIMLEIETRWTQAGKGRPGLRQPHWLGALFFLTLTGIVLFVIHLTLRYEVLGQKWRFGFLMGLPIVFVLMALSFVADQWSGRKAAYHCAQADPFD